MQLAKELVGIGIDSISWNRIERFLTRHSFPFIKRLLTPSEQNIFQDTSQSLQFFARCFAAKEATFKARGGFWMGESGFREIDVVMEGREGFRIRGDSGTEGKFFEIPDGIIAQVIIWRMP